jgi:hypothetical protein
MATKRAFFLFGLFFRPLTMHSLGLELDSTQTVFRSLTSIQGPLASGPDGEKLRSVLCSKCAGADLSPLSLLPQASHLRHNPGEWHHGELLLTCVYMGRCMIYGSLNYWCALASAAM